MGFRGKATIGFVSVGVVAAAAVLGFGSGGAESAQLAVSAKGKRVKVAKRDAVRLRNIGYSDVFLLGTRSDRAFYRVVRQDGRGPCYGVGFAADLGRPGHITCWQGVMPLMDFSVVEVTRASPEPRLLRVEGVAADGIESVGMTDGNGNVVAQTKVVRNAYHFEAVPTGQVDGLVALDAEGDNAGSLRFGRQ